MNYAEIDINGQKVGLKFGFDQAKWFAIAIAENVESYFDGDNMTVLGLSKLLHTAYKNNCAVKEVKPTLTLEDFNDFLEENNNNEDVQTQMGVIVGIWQESRGTKMWLEQVKKKTQEINETLQQTKQKDSTKATKRRSTQAASASVS